MKTRKTKANAAQVEAVVAKRIGVKDVPIKNLVEAKWNVHLDAAKEPGDMNGLVESVRRNGVIQRVVARPVGGDVYEIVDGHRRVEAAKRARLEAVPCDIVEATDQEAQIMTATANLQREDNDPMLEAELVARLRTSGMTNSEIAARTGKTEAWVVRRGRLTELTKSWRKFARRIKCTTDLLEKVAAHSADLQNRVAADVGLDEYDFVDDGLCGWGEFRHAFWAATRTVSDAAFDTAECRRCPKNTANQKFLFDFMSQDGTAECGRCQDAACYVRKSAEAVDELVARAKRDGMPAVTVSDRYRIPDYWDTAETRDKSHPQAYVFEADGVKRVVWGKERQKKASTTPEEREARRKQKIADELVKNARIKVSRALADRRPAKKAMAEIAAKWMADILDSGFVSDERCDMAWAVVRDSREFAGLLTTDEQKAYDSYLKAKKREV